MDKELLIKQSHARCRSMGLQPELFVQEDRGEQHALLVENRWLIQSAHVFMQLLREFIGNTQMALMLTDSRGCVLDIRGDLQALFRGSRIFIRRGHLLDEEHGGTNPVALVLKHKKPIQIEGDEHYFRALQHMVASAAPIFDEEQELIGVLNFCGFASQAHPHTLGWVVAAAKAVEGQWFGKHLTHRLRTSHQYLQTLIDNLTSGIMSVNKEGRLMEINQRGRKMLKIPEDEAPLSMKMYLPDWPQVQGVLDAGHRLQDEELRFWSAGEKLPFIVIAYPLTLEGEKAPSYIFSLRETSMVYKTAARYSGMQAHFTFDHLIGRSLTMQKAVRMARSVADSPSTVLITGESGTGKELFAQAIHNESWRKEQSFVAVNCGALPESLIESELFGHDEGAFTGARRGGQPGKFELANGGTLFLDEIGEMPMEMQVKLLRAIQEQQIQRVGGQRQIRLDVRIIAATNRNLMEEVQHKRFRKDLYYRLNVLPISLPPLREREGDVPLLADYFLHKKSIKQKRAYTAFSQWQMEQLCNYSWPGNVRELENFVEQFVNLHDKAFETASFFKAGEKGVSEVKGGTSESVPDYTLEEMEREYIKKMLLKYQCNKTKVAEVLGVSRNTLYLKIKKMNL